MLRDLAVLLRTVFGPHEGGKAPQPTAALSLPVSLSPALVDIYLASVHHDLADIERCVTQGDEKALNTALHKMKGAAKMVGATPLVEVIDRWQEAPGHPLAAALRQCVEEVCRQLGERA